MAMDRIVLGQHANTSIGAGVYVSVPGANAMHPEHARFGNLMFDSNEPQSTLNIIQTGMFKITCKRKSFSPRGENIGTRKNDHYSLTSPILRLYEQTDWKEWLISAAHTFTYDTGRPASLTAVANNLYGQDPYSALVGEFQGGSAFSHGAKIRTKQGNYLDTGSHTIVIDNPLPDGEIPEVALRFAVGTDEHQQNPYDVFASGPIFHPWYANTAIKAGTDGGSWSDIDYTQYEAGGSANAQQIVHMDSNWMRLKWGGLGAEEYRGTQEEHSWEALMDFFDGDADAIAAKFGFVSAADAETKIKKNSKLLSLALTNAQGVVGLIPYANSTHIHVDGYMSPTHAGLRQPIDRTFDLNAGRQKGIGFNAIDDFAHINFPIESHIHTHKFWATDKVESHFEQSTTKWHAVPSDMYASFGSSDIYNKWYEIVKNRLHAKLFKELPAIPEAGAWNTSSSDNIYNINSSENASLPINEPDHGKRDMYGWGGHPTEFFVNPFSNGTLTFYTHMQPPYLVDIGPLGTIPHARANTDFVHVGHYISLNHENEPGEPGWPSNVYFSETPHGQGPSWPGSGAFGNPSPSQTVDSFYVGIVDYSTSTGGTPVPRNSFRMGEQTAATDPSMGWEFSLLPTWGPAAEEFLGKTPSHSPMSEVENQRAWYYGSPTHLLNPARWGPGGTNPNPSPNFPNGGEVVPPQWYPTGTQRLSELDFYNGTYHGTELFPAAAYNPTFNIPWGGLEAYIPEYDPIARGTAPDPAPGLVDALGGFNPDYVLQSVGGQHAGYCGLWGTAWAPMHNVFNGASIKWPPEHPRADFLDHRDWVGSMGLAGAGSKESLASAETPNAVDTWDTFYVSYVVYSTGSVPPPEAALRPGAATLSESGEGFTWSSYLGSDL